MKKRKFNLKKEYQECWNYLRESRKFIYSILAIFLGFAFVGFFFPAPEYLINQMMELLREILGQTEGLSGFQLVRFIFFNNLKSSFFGMIFGVLFGILPVLAAIINGYVLGFVSSLSVAEAGVLSLWKLLPHGVFEFPAIFISLGLGLKFGTFVFQKEKLESFKEYLQKSFKVFVFIVFPLLIIAGIIEGCLISFLG